MANNPSGPDGAERKRSLLLSPVGVGAVALLGVGTFAATNGFGLAGRPCSTEKVVTSLAQCQSIMANATCPDAFTGNPAAVGLYQVNGSWQHKPLRRTAEGNYVDLAGLAFPADRTCRSSSSSSRSHSTYFWGGSSGTNSTSSSASQSQGVQRAGFGSTAHAMSSSSGS